MKNQKLTLQEILSKIQTQYKSKKSRTNKFAGYAYRNSDDMLQELKPYLSEYNVTLTINEELLCNEPPILLSRCAIHSVNEKIEATAIVGIDSQMKGLSMPQRWGAASSYCKKYSIANLMATDNSENDPDQVNTHGKESVNSKQWLTKGNAQWDKALEYMKSNGSITAIKEKYMLSKENEAELLKAK